MKRTSYKNISLEELSRRYSYDPETGDIISHRFKKPRPIGATSAKYGYKAVILVKNKKPIRLYNHRLAWLLHYGYIDDELEIDHINGVRDDNRIENLRLVTRQENMRNLRIGKANTSGAMGVREFRGKWIAVPYNNYLGTFDCFEDAAAAAKKGYAELGFHKLHGLPADERAQTEPEDLLTRCDRVIAEVEALLLRLAS